MSNIAKRNIVNNGIREKIWAVFWREQNAKKFLTETEIAILEKRLFALYWLDQGKSLRDTSKRSGLAKKSVVAIKHGFKKPITRPTPSSRRRSQAPSLSSRQSG